MLQQHPYLNKQENIVNKYNKPINLSQQLNTSQQIPPQQPKFEQNYTTPQWQKQMNPQFSIQQPQIPTTQSKYIPQTQNSQVLLQQQVPIQVIPQQVIVNQQPQQQYVQIMPQQQQVLRQSSPPRIYKTNQKIPYDSYQQLPPQQQYIPYQPPNYEYYPPPQSVPYPHPPPQSAPYPPIIQDSPYPPPIYEQPLPYETIYHEPIDPYFQPQYESQIKNFDDRGNRYPEYPFKALNLKDYFIKALINMATQEEYIEQAKIDVFREMDFRVGTLFSLFDYNQTGTLSIEEFLMGLKNFSLQPDMCDVRLLFIEYGAQEKMDIQQFGDMIRPKKTIKNVKAFDDDFPKLLPETKTKIRKLFVTLLNAESAYESERAELQAKENEFQEKLNFEELYDEIFQNDHAQDLKYYLQQNGQYFDQDTINSLFLRFDRNYTRKITVNELIFGFQPRLDEMDNLL